LRSSPAKILSGLPINRADPAKKSPAEKRKSQATQKNQEKRKKEKTRKNAKVKKMQVTQKNQRKKPAPRGGIFPQIKICCLKKIILSKVA
jgi:hypothetical protein